MSENQLRTLDPDEQLLIKLCIKLEYLSQGQIDDALRQHAGKQLIYALCDGNYLNGEQISKVLRLREYAFICNHCNNLNIREQTSSRKICKKCHKIMTEQDKIHRSSVAMGRQFGKYKIVEKVAGGSAGIVYKAVHVTLNRATALKILKAEHITDSLLVRFQREASAVASLDHPNIVKVYDIAEECGVHYIVMEYIEGHPLSHFIEKKLLTIRQTVDIVAAISSGLQHAHSKGIIHRDIKPENIIINDKGVPKITDFGLAKQVSQDVRLTQHNAIMGTPLYMSPEQAKGSSSLGPATDIYSLGVMLYEMLTGRTPFFHLSTITLLQKIITETPVPPKEINQSVSSTLQKICLKTIDKSTERRYRSMKEMGRELESLYRGGTKRFEKPVIENFSATNVEKNFLEAETVPKQASLSEMGAKLANMAAQSSDNNWKPENKPAVATSTSKTQNSRPISSQAKSSKVDFSKFTGQKVDATDEFEKPHDHILDNILHDPVFVALGTALFILIIYLFYKLL